jgi:fucose 4-O-acetylase-like acetyltransferase
MDFFNSKYILSNKRYGWIDYDRGISIILVTYRHCFEGLSRSGIRLEDYPFIAYINTFFFGFRMPLFFIASGIFISRSIAKRGLSPYVGNRIKTILYPMLVWGGIQLSLQLLMSDYTNSDMSFRNYLDLIIYPRVNGQFWYLNALFFVGVIYSTLKVMLRFKVMHQIILGLLLYFSLAYIRYLHPETTEANLGFLMDIMQYYLFFAVGDLISDFLLSDKAARLFSSVKLLIPLIISFAVIQFFFTEINHKFGDYHVERSMPFFFLLVALVGCTLSICVSFALKKHQSAQWLRVIGYNSVHIYCLQIIAMSLLRMVLTKVFHIYHPLILMPVILIFGLIAPMVFYNICLRLNLWWLFTLKRPDEEIAYIKNKRTNIKKEKEEEAN